jgi:hypothetical protein
VAAGQPQYRLDLLLVLEEAQHARPHVPGSTDNDHPYGALFTHPVDGRNPARRCQGPAAYRMAIDLYARELLPTASGVSKGTPKAAAKVVPLFC